MMEIVAGDPEAHGERMKLAILIVSDHGAGDEALGRASNALAAGVKPLADNHVPGTPGLVSVRRYLADDWRTLVF
jgi:hypothetical protein